MTIAKLIVALLFVAVNSYAYNNLATGDVIPERETFASFPDEFDGWKCTNRQTMEQDVLDNLGVTDYLICTYKNEELRQYVEFYMGYHEKQERSDSGKTTLIHPPEHCLPGSGWDIIDTTIIPVDFGIPGRAKRVDGAVNQEHDVHVLAARVAAVLARVRLGVPEARAERGASACARLRVLGAALHDAQAGGVVPLASRVG